MPTLADIDVPDVSDVVARIMAEAKEAEAKRRAEEGETSGEPDATANPFDDYLDRKPRTKSRKRAKAPKPLVVTEAPPDDMVEAVLAELAESFVPHPDEFLDDFTPQAAMMFGRQVSMKLLQIATGAAASLSDDSEGIEPVVSEFLNGAALAVAGHTHALVAVGVLPKEAEEALTQDGQ
jgi:hypothetical protein